MRIYELGHIVLYVTSIERVGNFYRDTLGFLEIAHRQGIAAFSAGRILHEMQEKGVPIVGTADHHVTHSI